MATMFHHGLKRGRIWSRQNRCQGRNSNEHGSLGPLALRVRRHAKEDHQPGAVGEPTRRLHGKTQASGRTRGNALHPAAGSGKNRPVEFTQSEKIPERLTSPSEGEVSNHALARGATGARSPRSLTTTKRLGLFLSGLGDTCARCSVRLRGYFLDRTPDHVLQILQIDEVVGLPT